MVPGSARQVGWGAGVLLAGAAAVALWPPPGSALGRSTPADPGAEAVVLRENPSLEVPRGKAPWSAQEDFRAAFPVTVDGELNHLALTTVTLLPGETVVLGVPAGSTVEHSAGRTSPRGPGQVAWVAPDQPGIHALSIRDGEGAEVRVTLLVAHSARSIQGGVLGGYRIGAYRSEPLGGNPAYLPPTGFVEVRPADHDVRVSPHFTLGEFLCKQPGNPKFVVVSTPLLVKLELILEAVNQSGIPAEGLTVMSGYRTPFYNRSIGNTTDYSRHLWGDAADVYVDEDGDGEMDDLNGDGVRNIADARFLARIVEDLAREAPPGYPLGGMASYRRNPAHGPFLHVDARGNRARW